MSYKQALTSVLVMSCLTSASYALTDNTSIKPIELDQCKTLAQLTPMDIFSQTQNGVSEQYAQTAMNCFKSNACTSLPDIDKPNCARSLALNSYLIDVAYKTNGPAYPPYAKGQISTITSINPAEKSKPEVIAPNTYTNLAPASTTIDEATPTTESTTETETIHWS